MKNFLEKYFSSENIEYFAVLSYSDCHEIGSHIIKRESFSPKSVIIYLLPYYAGESVNLSRYAASLDYHIAIRKINEGLQNLLKAEFPEAKMRGYGDHSPIDERHAAIIAGLGIAGKNNLILNKKYGSFVFIGDVVTDIEPSELPAVTPREIISCEGCGACLAACPTGFLSGRGECLSAITQRRGELSKYECDLMRECNTLWGCDACQSACPYNSNPQKTPIEFFYRDRIPYLTREILDSMNDESFACRAFAWRKRETLMRNIEVLFGKENT